MALITGLHKPTTRWDKWHKGERDMRVAIVRMVTGAFVAYLALACAPYSAQQVYEYEDRLNQARDQYVANKERCEQHGGSMIMRAQRLEKPGYHDYRLARCVRR
jgi:hypothetical protein